MTALTSPGRAPGRFRLAVRRPRVPRRWRTTLMIVGAVIIGCWILVALLAPLISPANPLAQNAAPLMPPSAQHLFGTDENGRDVLSRVLYGARVSLPLGVILVLLELVIGGILGALAGFFGGWVDQVIMRFTDLVFAFPTILLAMVVVAAMGPGIFHALIAVAAVGWPVQARVVRSLVRTTMQSDYVAVSRLLGASSVRALRVEVVRNVLGPVVVLATLGVGNAILLLSGLSFLGLGARPPMAEWGSMIASGSQNFQDWWLATFAGLAILTVVMGFNFIGDALRDALDPRSVTDEAYGQARPTAGEAA
jgi:peptide/nickel transport system permease protein